MRPFEGIQRYHAILGQTDKGPQSGESCIATNPSDMNVAMAALGATIHVQGPKGKRAIPIAEFHRLPGATPHVDTTLHPDELITAVELPPPLFAKNSWYLKVRDRQSYAFALVSVAAGLEMNGGTIQSAGLALGGVAHKPWRSPRRRSALAGQPATPESFRKAADLALTGAKGYEHNAFKIEMAKQAIVRRACRSRLACPRLDATPGSGRSTGMMARNNERRLRTQGRTTPNPHPRAASVSLRRAGQSDRQGEVCRRSFLRPFQRISLCMR